MSPCYIYRLSKLQVGFMLLKLLCGSGSKLLASLSSYSVVSSQSQKLTLLLTLSARTVFAPSFRRKKCFCSLGSLKTKKINFDFYTMGLSNFPTVAEGVLPVLVMNTVLSVALLKNMVRSVLQWMGAASDSSSSNVEDDSDGFISSNSEDDNARERRISITQFKSLCDSRSSSSSTVARSNGRSSSCLAAMECCVCLSGFQADEEVSELPCKHFFHRGCLDKWFDNKHSTCPLCRSIL